MTVDTSKIVNIAISRNTALPTGPGFGTLLIVGTDATSPISLADRTRTYSTIDAVAADFAAATEEYKAANAYFSANPRPTRVKIGVRDDAAGALADELDAIVAVDNDWYGVMLTAEARISDDPGLSSALAAWCESRKKLHCTASNEAAAIAAGGGLPGTLNAANYQRSSAWYHQDADSDAVNSYPEAAFFGEMLTVDWSGTNTRKSGANKVLAGISASPLNDTEFDFLRANNGNAVVTVAGLDITREGQMAGGEWFDTMHGIDAMEAEIQIRVLAALTSNDVVPYTKAGVEILVTAVREALNQFVRNGLLAGSIDTDGEPLDAFEVSAAAISSVSASDRQARKAPTITFVARLAGAIHFSQVNGTVTV